MLRHPYTLIADVTQNTNISLPEMIFIVELISIIRMTFVYIIIL